MMSSDFQPTEHSELPDEILVHALGLVSSQEMFVVKVEFCGYMGHRNREVELIKYFVDNSVALEKIIVDLHGHPYIYRWPVLRRGDRVAISRARQQLLPLLPSNVQLVIL